MTSSLPWKRIFAESTAIIASILIAFAIDAWWDGRRERAELRGLLEGLHAEFVENRRLIAEAESSTAEMREWLLHFHTSSPDVAASIPAADTYQQVYLPLVRGWDVTLSTGLLDASVSSGKLALIPSLQTRAALAAFAAAYEDLEDFVRQLTELGARAATVMGEFPGVRRMRDTPTPIIDPATLRALHADARLSGLASARLIWFEDFYFGLTVLLKPRVEDVVRRLEEDLAAPR